VIRRYHLHLPGFIYLALVLTIAVAAVNSQNNLLFWIFGVFFSGLLISGLISGIMMMGLRVKRLDPQRGTVGSPLVVQYALHNRNRFIPVFNVHVEESDKAGDATWQKVMSMGDAWVMHIGPRETVHGEVTLWPRHRGEARFDRVRVWTTFPFGLIKKSITFSQPQHTYIHPRLYQMQHRVLDTVLLPSLVGLKLSSQPGTGDDYFGMREYRPGDSLRHIAWKRTASRDELISIERSRPSPLRMRVMLNLTKSTDSLKGDDMTWEAARQLEERAISLAASLIHAATLAGYEVGLAVLGSALSSIPVRGSHLHRNRIMTHFASIDLDQPRIESHVPDAERVAVVVIHPYHVEPEVGKASALHLSATQLSKFTQQKIGVDVIPTSPNGSRKKRDGLSTECQKKPQETAA